MSSDRITELEIQLAHASRTVDELSAIVADQARRLELAEKRVAALMQRAAEQEAQGDGGVVMGDQPPPHW